MFNQPARQSGLSLAGVLSAKIVVPSDEAHKAVIKGLRKDILGARDPGFRTKNIGNGKTLFTGYRHNAFVNQGLQAVLDSAYGDLTADRITHIGVSGDSSTVSASTTTIGTPNSIKATANTSRTNQTVSSDQTWTQADVAFAIYKIGLLDGALPTDVVNIIGGTGGSAPYDEPFTIDLTNISTWTLTMGIDVTASAT